MHKVFKNKAQGCSTPLSTETTPNYEVTLPSMPSVHATAANSGDVNGKSTEKPYVNADRVEEFSKRSKKSKN